MLCYLFLDYFSPLKSKHPDFIKMLMHHKKQLLVVGDVIVKTVAHINIK
jgi:hypothetical protein